MRLESREMLIELVEDEIHSTIHSEFGGRSISGYKSFEKGKDERVLKLRKLLEELENE